MTEALDKLVAERVMGWHIDPMDGKWMSPSPAAITGFTHPEPYSTDMAAAWLIVEKLTSTTKQWFRLEQHSTGCKATFEISGAGDADREDSAEAETAPLAICLAALKAVR